MAEISGGQNGTALDLLYTGLPLGLFFGARQAARALGPPGVVIRPEGLQVGHRAVLPWTAVKQLCVECRGSKRDDIRDVIVIELDKAACDRAAVKQASHRINVRQHDTTISWVLDTLTTNASEAGVELPEVARA